MRPIGGLNIGFVEQLTALVIFDGVHVHELLSYSHGRHVFSFVLARGRSRTQVSPLRRDSVEPAAEPKAEVRIQYVQFEDGSSFGDETAAKAAIELRPVILEGLRRLDKAGNNDEFLALLKQKIQPDDADRFLATFRETQKNYGTRAARAQVRRGRIVAEGRVPALPGVQMVQK